MKKMKFRRIVKESSKDILQEIERMYGVKTAKALERYCAKKGIDPERVVNDMSMDKNGMCEWDKFDVWAQRQGIDFAANFGDVDMDSLLGVDDKKTGKKSKGHATKIYDRPSNSDIYGESFDEPADEYEMADFIARCLDREGTILVDENGDEADFFFEYNDRCWRVKVEEVEEYTSRDSMGENLPWKPKRR